MNTPIKTISDDQNTITHESGFVSVFAPSSSGCLLCVYLDDTGDCIAYGKAKCDSSERKDKLNGHFIPKP